MVNIIEQIEREQMRTDIPDFESGDSVKVHVKIREGEKERIQIFPGVVIKKTKGLSKARFIVRKISGGIGVERTFPLYSPSIDKIEVITRGRVRRAKLYYLRDRRGKSARIAEKRPA
ncbi:MAG: 50S ribosomal protein L19 [Desulfobacterales bacterium]|nr:50S ribosomal protein L19 [Desulfobacterales bacterium]